MSIVVVEYPTIMDGWVVRWYRDEEQANHGDELISASRNGVVRLASSPLAMELEPIALEVYVKIKGHYRGFGEGEHPWADVLTHVHHMFRDVEPIR